MKRLMILLTALMLLSLSACANETKETKQGATQMQLPPAYGTKPSYRLNIEGYGDKIEVFFNGSEMFHDFSRSQIVTIYPVNNYVTTGENELKVRIFAKKKQNFQLNPKGWFKVFLEIRDAKGSWQRLGGIVYDAAAKDPVAKSAGEGYYTLEAGEGFKAIALPAEAEVHKVQTEKRDLRAGHKVNSSEFTQALIFPTPFPRWKFLDSEDIIDYDLNKASDEEYEKLRQSPKMQKLYDAYEEINRLIKERKFEEVADRFKERIDEYSYAWRDTKHNLKQSLITKFKTLSDDPEYELFPFDKTKKYFFIEDNRKIAYIPSAIKFKKKGVAFQRIFGAKFRWDGKKWILTR
jgi:hypothetical protein